MRRSTFQVRKVEPGTVDSSLRGTDLHEQYQVRMEEGLDAFVVCDGLPVVPADSRPKLTKFILKKLTSVGRTSEEQVFMPVDESNKMTMGYAFVEYETPEQAAAAIKALNLTALDKRHTMKVNKLTDIERYGREGKIDEEYHEPQIEPFVEKDHLRWWLSDTDGRDQFVLYKQDNVGVYWNEKDDVPEPIVERQHWTESFVQWSPKGTYLTSMHAQGVQLWGGPQWNRQKRFAHPGVNLVDYSPNEAYLVTWSHRALEVDENNPFLSIEEDGKNYIIWDVATGKPLRSFATLDMPGPSMDEAGQPIKKKLQWPAFKWSCDAKYVARMTPGQSISVYELPRMNLLEKTSVKIEGVVDFEWAPAQPQRYDNKKYEQLLCFWTPELGSNPAKVALMSIPSKEIVRTRNLFNVTDAKLHWQSDAAYVCVKVDRHSKSKKSLATNLEIFRVKEKGVPVEVIDSIKDTVINFAWEPKGDRFVLITAGEAPQGAAVPPKTAVSFFCPEKSKTNVPGNFRHIKTVDKKNNNAIHWSPNGRFVLVATVLNQQSFDLDFYDFDFEGEKDEAYKDVTANLQVMNTGDHYGITDIEWDPSGRFVATSASVWKHRVSISLVLCITKMTNPFSRWKMATTCTTFAASSSAKRPSTASSNSAGAHDQAAFYPRKSKRQSARICASIARCSTSRTWRGRTQPTGRWWRSAGGSSRSGGRGASGRSRTCARTAGIWVCPSTLRRRRRRCKRVRARRLWRRL